MSTQDTRPNASIKNGPSRMDLLLALFDRARPAPVTLGLSIGFERPRPCQMWLLGLSKLGENSWRFNGTMTSDSPHFPNQEVKGIYNDSIREGTIGDRMMPPSDQ